MKVRRWTLLGLWILSLISISFYGGTISYGFFFGMTLLPVISLLYLAFVYFRFKIYQELEGRNVVCGESVPYFFVLQNDDYFAFTSISIQLFSSFSYVEKLPDGIEFELLPGDKITHKTKLVCKYRGEYEVGVKKIVITDFFRLFQFGYPVPSPIKALVRPRIVRVEALTSITDISALLQKEAFALRTEPDVLVRDYMEKDALKQIHWKATAREQKLKVRNRIGEEKQGISILCDTKRYSEEEWEYLPLENKILETLLALGIFFAERNMAFTAYYGKNGWQKSHVEGIKDFDGFYQRTAEAVFDADNEPQELFYQAMAEGALWNSKVVFCVLHAWDETVAKMTEQLAAGGVIVVIYLITDRNMEKYLKQSSLRRRIIAIPIEAELEGRL